MALRGADDVMAAVARAREAARGEPAARLARRAASAAERLALAEDPARGVLEPAALADAAGAAARLMDVPPPERSLLVDTLATGAAVLGASAAAVGRLGDAERAEKALALLAYAAVLEDACTAAEAAALERRLQEVAAGEGGGRGGRKGKKKQSMSKGLDWDWEHLREKVGRALAGAAAVDLAKLSAPRPPCEHTARHLVGAACAFLRSPVAFKDKATLEQAQRCVALVSSQPALAPVLEGTVDALLALLPVHEHVPTVLADMCALAVTSGDIQDTQLPTQLLLAIARVELAEYERQSQQDAAALRHTAAFLEELAARVPEVVAPNFAVLEPHLGGKAARLRSAIITALARVVRHTFHCEGSQLPSAGTDACIKSLGSQLALLLERVHDVAVHSRSRALQGFQYLASEMALPLGYWVVVAEAAVERLDDKGAQVRKSALQLLRTLLQKQPFGGQLDSLAWEGSLKEHTAVLESMRLEEATAAQAHGEALFNAAGEPVAPEAAGGEAPETAPEERPQATEGLMPGGVEAQQTLVASLQAGFAFCQNIEKALDKVVPLFTSPNNSDVTESMQFVIEAVCFQVQQAPAVARRVLPSILSKEDGVREATLDAFMQLYVCDDPTTAAFKMAQLASMANLGECAALEEIVRTLSQRGAIDEALGCLWDILEHHGGEASPTVHAVRGAVLLSSMASSDGAGPDPAHLDLLLDRGLTLREGGDPMIVQLAAQSLAQMGPSVAAHQADFPKRFWPADHKVFPLLVSVLAGSLGQKLPENVWYGAAHGAVAALYALHPEAEAVGAEVLCHLHRQLEASSQRGASAGFGANRLARFLFVYGHVALQQLVAIDKYRKGAQLRTASLPAAGEEDPDDEMKSGVGAVDESEQLMKDAVREMSEPGGLLAAFAPLVAEMCTDALLMGSHTRLQYSCLLALTKMMAINGEFCKKNLNLLFTALRNPGIEAPLRRNIVIALGDLAVRHPLTLDPWKEHLYRTLDDPDVGVRQIAISVLSFLVLNGVILPQGHIGHIATLLLDPDAKVQRMGLNFFVEFDQKVDGRGESQLYHSLPDILSYLLRLPLPSGDFQRIMAHLLGFVQKEAQAEFLLKNFLGRLDASASDYENNRRLAFCASELTVTEKGIKRMAELFRFYKDALVDAETLNHLLGAIAKSKRLSKPNSPWRAAIEELLQENFAEFVTKATEHAEAAEDKAEEEDAVEGAEKEAETGAEAAPVGAEEEGEEQEREDEEEEPRVLGEVQENIAAPKAAKGKAKTKAKTKAKEEAAAPRATRRSRRARA